MAKLIVAISHGKGIDKCYHYEEGITEERFVSLSKKSFLTGKMLFQYGEPL